MRRELDTRTNGHGERISLYWDDATGEIELEVEVEGGVLRARVCAPSARDAFLHPFMYVPNASQPA